jgi:hypothetical protein
MADITSVDHARLAGDTLEQASPDLLRAMVKTFAEALMGAEADAACGAPYGQLASAATPDLPTASVGRRMPVSQVILARTAIPALTEPLRGGHLGKTAVVASSSIGAGGISVADVDACADVDVFMTTPFHPRQLDRAVTECP